ncbi:MAG: carboxypeptidase regulatory-like domain-containing protein [Elusimicrobiales bacterium]|nr:carboxypeptidase regulatory-like domain-containing protein [Elusimicrobiales bacterium]
MKKTIFILAAAACLWPSGGWATNAPTPVALSSGPYSGTARFSWQSNDTLSDGDKFYVQYSTHPATETWDTANAQLEITTSAASGTNGSLHTIIVGGLNTGVDGSNNVQSPVYSFKVWAWSPGNGGYSVPSSDLSSRAATPLFPSVSATPYGGGTLTLESGLRDYYGGRLAVDRFNNSYLLNTFTLNQQQGGSEIVLRKYNAAGALQWVRLLNSPYQAGWDYGRAVSVNPVNGDVYVAGSFYNGSNEEALLAKYSTEGELLWLNTRPGNYGNARAQAVAFDGTYVYAGGYVVDFSSASSDMWLAKVAAVNGAPAWENVFNSTRATNTEDFISDLAIDATGFVYIGGQASNSAGYADMEIAKYDFATGDRITAWDYNSPANGYDAAFGLAVNPAGFAYLCGYEERSDLSQNRNLVVHRFNLALTTITWTRTYDNPYAPYSKDEAAYACAVDKFGGVYAAGYESRMDLGQGRNALYFKYTSDGQLVSTRNYVSSSDDVFYDVELSTTGDVLLAGQFGDSYGLYTFPQAGGSPFQLGSYAGEYTGSVQLSWTYPFPVPGGSHLYVQYSTNPAFNWSTATAQVDITTVAVPSGTSDGYLVRGLPASRDAYGGLTTPTYYFKVWLEGLSMGGAVYAKPRTPALSDTVNTYPQARLTYAESSPMSFATAMDQAGNIYQAFGVMGGGTMEGGWALRKYDKPSGRFEWTRFYNNTAATLNASPSFTIRALAVSSGVVYAAGSMNSDPTNMDDIYLAKVLPDGLLAWSVKLPGETMGMDYANAVALDAAGNAYVAGQIKTSVSNAAAMVKKFSPAGFEIWSSTVDAAAGSMGNRFNGIAVTTAAVFVAGEKGVAASDADIWLARYALNTGALEAQVAVSSPAASLSETAYGVAVGPDSDVYVAGRISVFSSEDAWLGKFINREGGPLDYVAASTYNVAGNMEVNYGAAYHGGYVYTAGYEMRNDIMQGQNIRVTKVAPATLEREWTKTFDNAGNSEQALNVMLDGSGIFAGASVMGGRPGIYTFLPPSFIIDGRPGAYPGTAEISWTSPLDLPAGSTYYFQASLSGAGPWAYTSAQTVFYTTAPVSSGMYQSYNIGGLDASRDGAGGITSPNYYFRVWADDGVTLNALAGQATAYANTPDVQSSAVTYPDSKVWTINNSYSWRNKSARDRDNNLYTVSNYWLSPAAGAAAAGGSNAMFVLRKYRHDMSVAWTKFFAARPNEQLEAYAVTVDQAGNLIVAGMRGTWDSQTKNDLLAVKYSAAGALLWSRTYDYGNYYDRAFAVTADADGNVYLGGSAQLDSPSREYAYLVKASPAGVQLTTAALQGNGDNWGHEIADLVYDSTTAFIYAAGNINRAGTGSDAFVTKLNTSLVALSTAVLTGADSNWDQGAGVAPDGLGNVYAAATVYSQDSGGDIWVRKLDATAEPIMSEVWTRTYNDPSNNYDSAGNLALDHQGSVYVAGSESRWDLNQGENLFLRKFSPEGSVIWSRSFNGGGSSYERGWDVHVDTAGYIYATGEFNGGFGVYRYRQIIFSNSNPLLSVYITSGAGAGYASGAPIIIMPFDQNGGINPELMVIGSASASGFYSARLPAGFQYFVGISTPGYKPTIKDQLMDPYGSFMVNLTGDATKQYRLYAKGASEPGYTLNIAVSSGLAAGDYLMGEVFYSKNGDKAAYGVTRSTSFNTSLAIHNVPPADAGVYGVNINVPGKSKATTLYLNSAFPGTSGYTVDMTSAVAAIGYAVGGSTIPPSFQAVVRSTWGAPIEGARVELVRWGMDNTTNCGGGPCSYRVLSYENLTDVNGKAVFNGVILSTNSYNLEIKKLGYGNHYEGGNSDCTIAGNFQGVCVTSLESTVTRDYMLTLATYTLTGILRYNNTPLPNASVMVHGDFNWASGTDSYAQTGMAGVRNETKVKTGADGTFTITGLTDGNVRLQAEFMGSWSDLNAGNDKESQDDDLRVTISSSTARKPGTSSVCTPGKVWVLDRNGACLAANNLQFNMAATGGNTLGTLYGNLTFVTTYTVTETSPLEIPASSPVVVMAIQDCDGGCDGARQLGFTPFSGRLTSNTTSYSIALSSGTDYWVKIYASDWGMLSSFNDGAQFTSTDTIRMDFTLTRSGGLRGQVKFPDGSNFKPSCSSNGCAYSADIEARGKTVQFSDGTGTDDYGAFEFPNVPPGTYEIYLKPRGDDFRWPPMELEGVSVTAGKTTEVKLTLQDGLVVQPQIFGLPEISTPAWTYTVLGVPSGFPMNQRNITELFFDQPQYYFNYSTTTASWDKKYMVPGQYDFYLVVGANYNPSGGDGDRPQSFYQFANFIGQVRGVTVKKSDSNPNIGTLAQPIQINVLGSVGQGVMAGHVTGSRIFVDQDFDKMFANFDSEIMPLIPAVMLYDTAGDLKGFSHALPDETAIGAFEAGMQQKDKALVLNSLAANPLRYLVWGMPPGRYTAVFVNPNYPPVAKEIQLPADAAYEFDFDAQALVISGISGVVKSSATGEALANARVYLKHRTVDKFTVTDSSGNFSFANLPAGIYRLEVTKDGFVKAGQKTGLAGNDSASFQFFMTPTESKITGRVYLSKFPAPSTAQGIKLVAYDETVNVQSPTAYLPKIEAQTGEDGSYEITGIIMGHLYKVSAFMDGKLPETISVEALNGDTVVDDIVLRDIPPQITLKVRKSPDSSSKVDVIINSPKALVTTPVCRYNPGEAYEAATAVSLALVPGANNSYLGQFTVSSNRQYYTVYVAAGDGDNRMEKTILYDQTNDAKTEQYIQDAAIAGGEIVMDQESEEYSGLELDAGAITTSSGTADFSNLVGGFFSALPSVRTVKTAKGNVTLEAAISGMMASEIYNMDLSNAQPNKPFTLTLKYDKERALNTTGLRIYQYDAASGSWKEIPGNYTVDPMTGVVSVDVASLELAYEGSGGTATPLGRKRFGMSAVKNGRYVPSATNPSSQTGRFAVFTAKPTTGKAAYSTAFDVVNMPNPFSLKAKTVNVSADGQGILGATYSTPGTLIKYNLPAGKAGSLKFVIYNLAGEKVRTIDEGRRDNTAGTDGIYYSEWDGKNDNNQDCASGVYLMLAFLDGKKLGNKAHKMAIVK